MKPDPQIQALLPKGLVHGGQITSVTYNDAPPTMFTDQGKLTGSYPNLATAAGKLMGVTVKHVGLADFANIIPGLQSKRYDLAFADIGVTKPRLKIVDILVITEIPTVFAVKKGSDLNITSASDLCGLKVATMTGSYFIDQVKALSKKCQSDGQDPITLKTFPASSATVLAVAHGRVDALASSADGMPYIASKPASGIQMTDFQYKNVATGVGFPKASPLEPAFVAAMKKLYKTGVYGKILKNWSQGRIGVKSESDFVVKK